MDLFERVLYLAIGGSLGFILGFIVASLRKIKEELDEVIEHEHIHARDERGSARLPALSSVALLVVVLMTAWATFQTAHVNGELNTTLDCITNYNTNQGEALDGRDAAIKAGTQSEIDLWTLYEKLYKIAKSDPKKIPVVQERLNKAIVEYRDILIRLQITREANPYPKPNVLDNC